MNKILVTALAATSVLFLVPAVHAATGTAQAKMTVIKAIEVTKVSDLLFSEGLAGSAAETVAADVTETPQNASFTISGEPNRAVTVTLPADGTVIMKVGSGGVDAEVAVNQFTSNTLSSIDPSGAGALYVGATRDALSATQMAGDYTADFTVDVVYQ